MSILHLTNIKIQKKINLKKTHEKLKTFNPIKKREENIHDNNNEQQH